MRRASYASLIFAPTPVVKANNFMTAAPVPPRPDIPARTHTPVRLLLINPKAPESFWNFKWAVERVLPGKRAVNPPLGLAPLAALCPADWQGRVAGGETRRR